MPYIQVIEHSEAEGPLKKIYDDLIDKRGKLAEVHKIQSLHPKSITAHMDLYMTIMFGKSPLKRYQREMIAVVVSVANHCQYCIRHHAEALLHFWKDEERVAAFSKDFQGIDLNPMDRSLCQYAQELTTNPGASDREAAIEELKILGLNDRAILDATLIIGYFNFVNRIVLGLGVELETEAGGYKYD